MNWKVPLSDIDFDQDEINFNANTTINFTVEDPESLPEMQFYIITTLIVVFVGAGILAYFKKYRK